MSDEIILKTEDVSYDDDEDIEEVDDFDYTGYEVVRREFYAHLYDAAVNFKNDSIQFNTACVNKINGLYIHLLVNPTDKKMVIKECDEDAKDAVRWCRISKKTGKKVPRKILCRLFALKMFDLLGWNVNYKYKLQGNLIRSNDELLIVFDLTATEIYTPVEKDSDGNKIKSTPYYPEGWRESFGLLVDKHQNALIVNLLEGYARLEVATKKKAKKKKEEATIQQSLFDLENGGGSNERK